jgi:hypothetical protein
MINDEPLLDDEFNDAPRKKIYSARLIRIFSIVFSPIFGGVLFFINLQESGKINEGFKILITSILFTFLGMAIVSRMQTPNSTIILAINFMGGYTLSHLIFPTYFSDPDQQYKKPWKPIIVAILVCIPFAIMTFNALQNGAM